MADENKPSGEGTPPSGDAALKPAAEATSEASAPKPAGEPAANPPPKPPPKKKAPAVMEVSPWEGPLADALKERFGEQVKECLSFRGQNFLVAELPGVIPIIEYLKLEQGFDYLVDITAVDYPKNEKRFEVIWILYSFSRNERVRIMRDAVSFSLMLHLSAGCFL